VISPSPRAPASSAPVAFLKHHGRSTYPPVRDCRVHVGDLAAVVEHIGAPAHVLGWSSGSNTALALATARPELFRSLIIVEAPFHGLRRPTGHLQRSPRQSSRSHAAGPTRGLPTSRHLRHSPTSSEPSAGSASRSSAPLRPKAEVEIARDSNSAAGSPWVTIRRLPFPGPTARCGLRTRHRRPTAQVCRWPPWDAVPYPSDAGSIGSSCCGGDPLPSAQAPAEVHTAHLSPAATSTLATISARGR
jgi:pimeloyl-ACP methyl ester carboxylesterase